MLPFSIGGVENHIWSLSQCLLRRSCKVVVITHMYGEHEGIRYMPGGLKVYYTPITTFVKKVAFPTYTALFPILRDILIREDVSIVHGHQVLPGKLVLAVRRAAIIPLYILSLSPSLFLSLAFRV